MTPAEIASRLTPTQRKVVMDPAGATSHDFMDMHETIGAMLWTPMLSSPDGGKVAEAIAAVQATMAPPPPDDLYHLAAPFDDMPGSGPIVLVVVGVLSFAVVGFYVTFMKVVEVLF